MKQNVIHIGFPKTGTTSLQEYFFSKHPQINYLGQPYDSDEILNAIEVELRKTPLLYKNNSQLFKNVFLKEISSNSNDEKKINLLSAEGLSFQERHLPDRTLIANRLCDIFGKESKIIITIRNQKKFILSMYSQSIRSGYYLSLSAFIEYLVNYYETASFLSQIHYLNLINYYEKLFGKENVLVLCFEELVEDEDLFLSKICEFIEVKNINIKLPKRNPGLGKSSILIQRLLNRIVTYDLGRPHFSPGVRLPGKRGHSLRGSYKYLTYRITDRISPFLPFNSKLQFPKSWEERFSQIFKEDNKILNDEYNLNLKKYNYPGF